MLRFVLVFVALTVSSGCCFTHDGSAVFANARRTTSSGAPPLAKAALAPAYFAVDLPLVPFGAVADAVDHAPRSADGRTYCTFAVLRSLQNSPVTPGPLMVPAGLVALALDLAWLPAAVAIDLARTAADPPAAKR